MPHDTSDPSPVLFDRVYQDLHRLASAQMRSEHGGHILQTTALVHEAYVRLADWQEGERPSRRKFLAVASNAMRRILVDFARLQRAQKRSPEGTRISLGSIDSGETILDVVEVNDLLERLENLDERKARIVELRVFGGLTIPEVAVTMDISHSTVSEDWRMARAWLMRELAAEGNS